MADGVGVGDDAIIRELQAREARAQEEAASTRRKLDRAMNEIVDLREQMRAARNEQRGRGQAEEGGEDKDAVIAALQDKLRFVEEDHRQRSERITEVSERLMLKRKEERDMIDNLRQELADKDKVISKLQETSYS